MRPSPGKGHFSRPELEEIGSYRDHLRCVNTLCRVFMLNGTTYGSFAAADLESPDPHITTGRKWMRCRESRVESMDAGLHAEFLASFFLHLSGCGARVGCGHEAAPETVAHRIPAAI